MLVLPKAPHKKLTAEQQKAFEAMRELLQDIERADRRYDELEHSHSGRIISTDIARHLDTRYAKEPKKDQERDIEPGWELAWRYAQNRLVREIENRASRKRLRLMSGGWGAGKTFALRHEPTVAPCLIWDGTLDIGIIDLERNGALHYLPRHEHYYSQAAENLDSGVRARGSQPSQNRPGTE